MQFNTKLRSQASPIQIQGFTIRYCWNIKYVNLLFIIHDSIGYCFVGLKFGMFKISSTLDDVETLPPLVIVFDGGSAWEVLRPFVGVGDNSVNHLIFVSYECTYIMSYELQYLN